MKYPNTIKEYTASLLNMFNNLRVENQDQITKVPVLYATREKLTEIEGLNYDDLIKRNFQVVPRGSLQITSIEYDPSRQLNPKSNVRSGQFINKDEVQPSGAPYNITYSLNILTKSVSEATMIIEQVCSRFNPYLNNRFVETFEGAGKSPLLVKILSVDLTHPEFDGENDELIVEFQFMVYGTMFEPVRSVERIETTKLNFEVKV